MKSVSDKRVGGTIPGSGNYQASEFNSAVKRELLATVYGTNQTPDENTFLQLTEAINRMGLVCSYYTQTSFTNNTYDLKYSGYQGQAISPALDPTAQPVVSPETYHGVTELKAGSVIIFAPQSSSINGADISINISVAGITNAKVKIPDYNGSFVNLDTANDFVVNEYVCLLYNGADFIVINTLLKTLLLVKNNGYEQTGFDANTNAFTLTSGNNLKISQYYNGMRAVWFSNNTIQDNRNGVASIKIDNLTAKSLVRKDGSPIQPYDISTYNTVIATYNRTQDKFYLDSKPVTRNKNGYDTATLWQPVDTAIAAGTPSATLFILKPRYTAGSENVLGTYDSVGQHAIAVGTRIVSYISGSNSTGGDIQLQLVKNDTDPQGTFPNTFPLYKIKKADGTNFAANSFKSGMLYEFLFDGTNWLVLNSSQESNSKILVAVNLIESGGRKVNVSSVNTNSNITTINFTNSIDPKNTTVALAGSIGGGGKPILSITSYTTTHITIETYEFGSFIYIPFTLTIFEIPS